MILDMRGIYTKYLNKANKIDKKRDKIYTCALGLEQELHSSNEEKGTGSFSSSAIDCKGQKLRKKD